MEVVPEENKRITWDDGGGARFTQDLIKKYFVSAFRNPFLDPLEDAATVPLKESGQRLAFSTDTYAISPLFFPGGDIGKVAVNGTINDLAAGGAEPLCLSASFILEVGFPIEILKKIVYSMAEAARIAEVPIVTGDTKVVDHIVVRGRADDVIHIQAETKEILQCAEKRFEMLINTAGIGIVSPRWHGATAPQPADCLLLSGPIGDHGVATMLALHEFQEGHEVKSDSKSLYPLVSNLLDEISNSIRCFKHPTRGGLALALHEVASRWKVGIGIDRDAITRHANPEVLEQCQLLGTEYMEVPNEGILLVIVSPEQVPQALEIMNDPRYRHKGRAAMIGRISSEGAAKVSDKAGKPIPEPIGYAFPKHCG